MGFVVGQKIVCIDDSPCRCGCRGDIKRGEIYTVHSLTEENGISLCEVPLSEWHTGYDQRIFRPVVEKKTDISIFTAMLKTERSPVLTD